MALSGLSTLGITFGYGVEATAGTKPATFNQLTRINQIGEVSIDPEKIDASALEDSLTKNIAGRGTVSDTMSVTVNLTPETQTEWETLISAASTAKASGLSVWFQTIIPGLTKTTGDPAVSTQQAFFVVAEPPTSIPQPSLDQNGLLTVEMNLTVNDYKGIQASVSFT